MWTKIFLKMNNEILDNTFVGSLSIVQSQKWACQSTKRYQMTLGPDVHWTYQCKIYG